MNTYGLNEKCFIDIDAYCLNPWPSNNGGGDGGCSNGCTEQDGDCSDDGECRGRLRCSQNANCGLCDDSSDDGCYDPFNPNDCSVTYSVSSGTTPASEATIIISGTSMTVDASGVTALVE